MIVEKCEGHTILYYSFVDGTGPFEVHMPCGDGPACPRLQLARERGRVERAEQALDGWDDSAKNIEFWAEAFHNAWMRWATTVMRKESLTIERRERWIRMLVPYSELPEETKDQDPKEVRTELARLKESERLPTVLWRQLPSTR